MQQEMESRLAGIFGALSDLRPENPSLMDGDAGILLFLFSYLLHTKDPDLVPFLSDRVQRLAESAASEDQGDFCKGLAGIHWFFTYLYRKGVLSREDWAFLCERDKQLEGLALAMLEDGNYEFLYGGVGVGYYLLYAGKGSKTFYKHFFTLLSRFATAPDKVDLGLSHGITAILKCCLQSGAGPVESKVLANRIVDDLMGYAHMDGGVSCFPNFAGPEAPDTGSRLAWCYGDLGIAYTLHQAGVLLRRPEVTEFALRVLDRCAARRSDAETRVGDAGFCHGSAGIAHIFYALARQTQRPAFGEAGDHWMRRTLDMTAYPATPALLEGTTGIGLVLLSHLTGDRAWDYCLMLNN